MGEAGEGQNITHQQKKMTEPALFAFRDRFELPLTDDQVHAAEYYRPPEDSPEMRFLRERRAELGGSLPARRTKADSLPAPPPSTLHGQIAPAAQPGDSATMAVLRMLLA